MGIYLSATVGVGVVLDPAQWQNFQSELKEKDSDLYGEENFWWLEKNEFFDLKGLHFGEAGSMMSGEVYPYIAIDRLTNHYDQWELPAEVLTFSSIPSPSSDEWEKISRVIRRIQPGFHYTVEPFVSFKYS